LTQHGPDTNAPGQPGTAEGAMAAPQGPPYQQWQGSPQGPDAGRPYAEPAAKGGAKKWASLAGTVAVVGIGGAYALTGGFGFGDPKVDDCIRTTGENSFEVVGCDSGEAEYTIVGIEDEKLTEPDFMADPDTCMEFASAEAAFWMSGSLITDKGAVYCAAPA
jgi:hypothetical protein